MNTSINLAGIKMKNPVTVASRNPIPGYGREFEEFLDPKQTRRNMHKRNITKTKSRKQTDTRVCETKASRHV